MRAATMPGCSAFVLLASSLLFAQQQSTTPAPPRQTNAPAEEQPTNPNPPPSNEPVRPTTVQPPTGQPQASESGQQSTAAPKARERRKAAAWQILGDACTGDRAIARVTAIRVLGLMPDDAKAQGIAEKALADDKPEERSAGGRRISGMETIEQLPTLEK